MQADRRDPRVFWFNPACDRYAGLGLGHDPSARVRAVQAALESLPMFLAGDEDVVLVRRPPSPGFLRRLQECGFSIPEFTAHGASPRALAAGDLGGRRLGGLCPWGWSPDSVALAEPLFEQVRGEERRGPNEVWNERIRQLYSKAWSAGFLRRFLEAHPEESSWLCDPEVIGCACDAMAPVEEAVTGYQARGFGTVVVKAAFGAAAQNQVRLGPPNQVVWQDERQRRQVEKLLEEYGAVVVEPWLDKVVDLSVQLQIGAPGTLRVVGNSRFVTNARGQYIGSLVRPIEAGLGADTRRLLDGDGSDPQRLARLSGKLGAMLGDEAGDTGFAGPLGVDALVYESRLGLRLKPVVEINPRYTMGRLVLEMSPRVCSDHTAVWLVLRVRDIETAGYAGPAEFAEGMGHRHPVEMTPGDGQISRGVLFTTDPTQAESVVTLMAVGESLAALERQFRQLGRPLDAWTTSGRRPRASPLSPDAISSGSG